MSTLGKMLRLDVRDREHFYPRKPFKIEEIYDRAATMDFDRVTRYQLCVTYSATVSIPDALYRAGMSSDKIDRAHREILDGVYGEYTKPLIEAVRQIDNYEPEKARDIILKVMDNMRNSEPMKEQP